MNFHDLKRLVILLSVFSFAPNVGHAASYAPLDCAKTSTAAEMAICKSYALGQDEAALMYSGAGTTTPISMDAHATMTNSSAIAANLQINYAGTQTLGMVGGPPPTRC